ncbi:uncharacterized protein [Arachis hypogaea]|uniref:uncharacterized protein n=1 Tax=Arachis hypogaea TaxID=3818 RepID=UPI003B21FA15
MELASPSAMATVPRVTEKRHRCCRRKPPLKPVSFGVVASCCCRNHCRDCRFMVQSLLVCVLLWSLRKWLEAEVSVAGDFELRRKGLCETFGLWICVLRIWAQKLRRIYLVIVVMLCIALDYYLLYPRLYLDIICKRDRNFIGLCL